MDSRPQILIVIICCFCCRWGISIANIADFKRPADKISYPQQCAVTLTGVIWTRFATVITPVRSSQPSSMPACSNSAFSCEACVRTYYYISYIISMIFDVQLATSLGITVCCCAGELQSDVSQCFHGNDRAIPAQQKAPARLWRAAGACTRAGARKVMRATSDGPNPSVWQLFQSS